MVKWTVKVKVYEKMQVQMQLPIPSHLPKLEGSDVVCCRELTVHSSGGSEGRETAVVVWRRRAM